MGVNILLVKKQIFCLDFEKTIFRFILGIKLEGPWSHPCLFILFIFMINISICESENTNIVFILMVWIT